jgi:hypothetical protein
MHGLPSPPRKLYTVLYITAFGAAWQAILFIWPAQTFHWADEICDEAILLDSGLKRISTRRWFFFPLFLSATPQASRACGCCSALPPGAHPVAQDRWLRWQQAWRWLSSKTPWCFCRSLTLYLYFPLFPCALYPRQLSACHSVDLLAPLSPFILSCSLIPHSPECITAPSSTSQAACSIIGSIIALWK